ncbi:MAG: DUF4397 domain-containing protein [Gammaproteobacteria bacterium]
MRRLIIIVLAAVLAACDDSGGGDGLTEIRFVNLVTDSSLVVFQVEEDNFPSVGFELATPLQRFGGTYPFDLELINADGTLTTLVDDRTLTIDGDNEWTFVSVGTVAAPDFIAVVAANGDPAANFAKLQFINSTLEEYTAYIYAAGQFGSGTSYSATIAARGFDAPAEVVAQSVQVRIERADTSIAFESEPIDLLSLDDVTFVITDYAGPGPAVAGGNVLLVERTGAVGAIDTAARPATLRYVHSLTNLGDDATVTRTDSMQASTDATFSFATASPRETIAAGAYDFAVAPAGNPGAPVYNVSLTLDAGIEYALVLLDDIAAPDNLLLVEDTRAVANIAKLSLIHAAPGLAEVDVYVSVVGEANLSGTLFTALAHRATLEITTGGEPRVLTVTNTATNDVVAGPLEVSLSDGAVVSILLHDAETGGSPFALTGL